MATPPQPLPIRFNLSSSRLQGPQSYNTLEPQQTHTAKADIFAMAAAVAVLIPPLSAWFLPVDRIVTEPYLDEVFHVRQAQHYCAGDFHIWDPKITTPPGLYWVSYAFHKVLGCDIFALRAINAIGLAALVLAVQATYGYRMRGYQNGDWTQLLVQHSALNIALFPPLFFFSALYYTDVLSTLFVVLFYVTFLSSCRNSVPTWYRMVTLVPLGLASLSFRQTNIFWVAIYPAGLVLVQYLDRGHAVVKDSMARGVEGFGDSMWSIAKTSWKMEVIYDPSIQHAWVEDYVKTIVSLVVCPVRVATQPKRLLGLIAALLPYLTLLALFATFIMVNGGVVLGDKSNHVATLHLPQMLYIWPYITFFSWPLVYSSLLVLPVSLLARLPQYASLEPFLVFKRRPLLPRLSLVVLAVLMAGAVVQLNTMVHPFTLADNRHYTFYVFRLLLRPWWIRYAVTPLYVACGWACMQALGWGSETRKSTFKQQTNDITSSKSVETSQQGTPQAELRLPPDGTQSATVSFVLIWLATSSLQLITAPLVEPRYFILPWIFWRLHLPLRQPEQSSSTKEVKHDASWQSMWEQYDLRLWLETIWMLAINAVTGYIFLNWEFTWPQEAGKVQRFMW